MNSKWKYIILAAIASVIPIILIKKYITDRKIKYIILAMFVYLFEFFIYSKLFEYGCCGIFYSITKILAIVIIILISITFYHEPIKTKQIIGLIFGIIAIVLLG